MYLSFLTILNIKIKLHRIHYLKINQSNIIIHVYGSYIDLNILLSMKFEFVLSCLNKTDLFKIKVLNNFSINYNKVSDKLIKLYIFSLKNY